MGRHEGLSSYRGASGPPERALQSNYFFSLFWGNFCLAGSGPDLRTQFKPDPVQTETPIRFRKVELTGRSKEASHDHYTRIL
jgi:hypothetical protein